MYTYMYVYISSRARVDALLLAATGGCMYISIYIPLGSGLTAPSSKPKIPLLVLYTVCTCRDGGNTFTPERYRLELNSAHTFTGRQPPSDPHTVSGVFFLRKQN